MAKTLYTEADIASEAMRVSETTLYVEGTTDCTFWGGVRVLIKAPPVVDDCCFRSRAPIKKGFTNKGFVRRIALEEGLDTYGIIDKDFEVLRGVQKDSRGKARLFNTDTHDLETLIFRYKKDFLHYTLKSCGCSYTPKDQDTFEILWRAALNRAYQLGVVKKIIEKYGSQNYHAIYYHALTVHNGFRKSPERKIPDYEALFPGESSIDLDAAINLVFSETESRANDRQRDFANLLRFCKAEVNKYLNYKGKWKGQKEYEDYWDVINGHDAIALFIFFSKNRTWEGSIGDYFTQLYKNLVNATKNNEFEATLATACGASDVVESLLFKNLYEAALVEG